MEYPRLTPEQLTLNNVEFNALIANVRKLSSPVADLLMQNRSKLDRHVKAIESEVEVIEQFHIAKLKLTERRNAVSGIRRG